MAKKFNSNRPASPHGTPGPEKTPLGPNEEYRVGPRRPPKEFRFKPGQSGNPTGLRQNAPPLSVNLKAALERALNERAQGKSGARNGTLTMAQAGIRQLVAQYARGDHRARRDLIALAGKLGVDLTAGQSKAIEEEFTANYQAILNAYVERQYDVVKRRDPVFAPPELLDDDVNDKKGDEQ